MMQIRMEGFNYHNYIYIYKSTGGKHSQLIQNQHATWLYKTKSTIRQKFQSSQIYDTFTFTPMKKNIMFIFHKPKRYRGKRMSAKTALGYQTEI